MGALQTGQNRHRDAQALVAALESTEWALLELVLDGHSLLQLAGRLGVTPERASLLKLSTMEKLDCATTADLVRVGLYARVGAKGIGGRNPETGH